MPLNLGIVEYVKLMAAAFASGRLQARDIKGMSDEGVEQLISQLEQEAADEVQRGKDLEANQ